MAKPKVYVRVLYEAVYDANEVDLSDAINHGLEEMRAEGSAKVFGAFVLDGQEAYDNWYRAASVDEIELPVPTKITWDH